MPDTRTLLILIPALPLAASLLTAVLGARVLRERSHWPTVLAIALSCVASLLLIYQVHHGIDERAAAGEEGRDGAARLVGGGPVQQHGEEEEGEAAESEPKVDYEHVVSIWTWAVVDDAYELHDDDPSAAVDARTRETRSFSISVTLRADPLTAIMLGMVTFVSLVIAVYSIGYMHHDSGYWRFFSYIPLFVFSMTMLVSVSNFVLLYVFWEAVGFCSYILIGFWYQKPEAAAAGKKAFLVNRVGDFGFALGLFLLWTAFGTLDFHDVKLARDADTGRAVVLHDTELVTDSAQPGELSAGVLGRERIDRQQEWLAQHGPKATGGPYHHGTLLAMAICLLLMLGACGKSAQFPLHVWLPDAMEGPTPVSALIHAATMVTAGVYMVARCMPLFLASTTAQYVVAVIGGFTALLAALIALTQTDLKRILAYSTISQLGYMFLGLGAATLLGVTAGMFHLLTHAFFKALLFLGAGSVMHAMAGVIDIRRFGGLRRVMPVTHWTFLFGCLALAGIFPFAGFWSKDLILEAVHEQAGGGAGAGALMYQALYWAAVGTAALTAFYTFRAYFLTFWGKELIPEEAGDHAHESSRVMTVPLMVLALCALGVGAYFEWTHGFSHFLGHTPSAVYHAGLAPAAEHGGALDLTIPLTGTAVSVGGILLAALLYVGPREKLVAGLTAVMTRLGLYRVSHRKFYFDEIYYGLVVGPLKVLAWLSYAVDRFVIDGLVNVCGLVPKAFGATLRPLQNGMIQFYALAMILGLLVLMGALLPFLK